MENVQTEFTKNGLEQLNEIKNNIYLNGAEIIYTSDFNRTVDTGKYIAASLGLPLISSKSFRGLNMGVYQGKPFIDFISSSEVKKSLDNHNIPFEDGESINDLNKRYLSSLNDICINSNYKKIAIISHSAAISNLKSSITSEPYQSLRMWIICITIWSCEFRWTNQNTPWRTRG